MAEYIHPSLDWVRKQVDLYEGSGGTEGTTLLDTGLPCILVTHKGNRTGAIRKIPLTRVKETTQTIRPRPPAGFRCFWPSRFRSRPMRANAKLTATLSGPVEGGQHGWPFAASLQGVAALGYEEHEYFLAGTAKRYRDVDDSTAPRRPVASGGSRPGRIPHPHAGVSAEGPGALQRQGDTQLEQRHRRL